MLQQQMAAAKTLLEWTLQTFPFGNVGYLKTTIEDR